MGLFSVAIGVGHPEGGDLVDVWAVVDTGAHYSMLPASMLEQLRIRPVTERVIGFADGNKRAMGVGQARIACAGDEMTCPVIFGPENKYLMGATTLGIFSLGVDPVNRALIPVEFQARPF